MNESSTKRAVAPALENILYERIPILDHGFIRVIDYMGNDSSIVQAARVSYGAGTKKVHQDKGLISYLVKHRHTTPLEMCEIKIHVKLPIFVARQWIRHRTANVNEQSGRYSVLDKEFYLPNLEHICPQSRSNKQGREEASHEDAKNMLEILKSDSERCYNNYSHLLGDEDNAGIARELARMNLTLNYYTQWYWKIDLHNLLHFVSLRATDHAQYEIRVYALALLNIIKLWVPYVHEAFVEHVLEGIRLSKAQIEVLRGMINKNLIEEQSAKLKPRDWEELKKAMLLDRD
jgi:thymidylate synthase (FAD)